MSSANGDILARSSFLFVPKDNPAGFPVEYWGTGASITFDNAENALSYVSRVPQSPVWIMGDFATRSLQFVVPRKFEMREVATLFKTNIENVGPVLTVKQFEPTEEGWMELVFNGLDAIKAKRFEKVVLARRALFKDKLGIEDFRKFLHTIFSSSGLFYKAVMAGDEGIFFSKTPERLVSWDIKSRKFTTEAVASTRAQDAKLADFENSSKDQFEHNAVVNEIARILKNVTGRDSRLAPQKIMQQSGLSHLRTPIEIEDLDLDAALHAALALNPTPAVAGLPTQASREWIVANEGWARGHYAAPLGVLTAERLELCVALRSGTYHNQSEELELYTGAGIVSESDPRAEWTELNLKLSSILGSYSWQAS